MNDPKFQAGINRAIRRLAEHSPRAVVWSIPVYTTACENTGHVSVFANETDFPPEMYAAAWEAFCKVLDVDASLPSVGHAFVEWTAVAYGIVDSHGREVTPTHLLVGYICEDPAVMGLLDNFYGAAVRTMRVQRGFAKAERQP